MVTSMLNECSKVENVLGNKVDIHNNDVFLNRRICTCRRKTCNAGDICNKDKDCGYLTPISEFEIGKRGTCEKVSASYPFTKKRLEYVPK